MRIRDFNGKFTSECDDLFDRLFDRTIVKENGCWEFTGSLNFGGYGRIWYNGKEIRAHRASYMLCKGEIPNNLCVLHTCDNRCCVNPEHLFVGTDQDNSNDMVRKGRNFKPIGELHPRAKLNKEKVQEIRTLLEFGSLSMSAIAERFNISRSTISHIKTGYSWKEDA